MNPIAAGGCRMNRVVHFEIYANDAERAKLFYQQVFGWKFEKYEGNGWEYWMVMTAEPESKEPGINGGLVQRTTDAPAAASGSNAFVCTVQVDNFDVIAEKIKTAGGKVALPKGAIEGMAWQGYFIDTEGNTFGLYQPDENAR